MTKSIEEIRRTSPAFRQALLRSERKRIAGATAFILFFALLAAIRIFVFGSAMNRWGLVAMAMLITFEVWMLSQVNDAMRSRGNLPTAVWYLSTTMESLFPAFGVAFLVTTRVLPEYRPIATPWVLSFFPFILLSVLRLSVGVCFVSGIASAGGYIVAAYLSGWHFIPGPAGLTAIQTAVPFFALVLLLTGGLAGGVAAEIRTHVETALREVHTQHQLQQVEHELQIARSIQQSLLPKVRPQIQGFEVAGWSRTAADTGGDFYDWKRLPDGRWVIVLADVTGHGIGPAILASVCRAYSRANFGAQENLGTILRNINRSFAEDLTPERYATFVAVLCEENSDHLELLSAGHGPIFVYSPKTHALRLIEAQALPLGILPDLWDATPVSVNMHPGDVLILLTDGFWEWENRDGEQFGIERVLSVVQRVNDQEPEVIIAELYDSVLNFAAGTQQQDDLTAVLIKRSLLAVTSSVSLGPQQTIEAPVQHS